MFFEVLEQRRLLSIALDSHGLLTVIDGNSSDTIKVGQTSSLLQVYLNGVTTNFTLSKVKKLALYGNSGNDVISLASNVKIPALLDGGAGDDLLTGGAGIDSLYGEAGNDTLIAGTSGKDSIFGADGNDRLVAGVGSDTYSGGAGTDVVDFSKVPGHLTLKMGYGAISGAPGQHAQIYSDIENLIGNNEDGCIVGTTGPNFIQAGSGNTTIVGNGGNDTLFGGGGSDTYMFLPSTKTQTALINEGPGAIKPTALLLANVVTTTASNALDFTQLPASQPVTVNLNQDVLARYGNTIVKDYLPGQFVNFTTVLGGAGDDVMTGNNGNDSLAGNGGDDSITGGNGKNTVDGGAGDDTFFGTGAGANEFIGGFGSNTVDFSARTDDLVLKADDLPDSGAPGEHDIIHSDITTIIGSQGRDSIVGAVGKDDELIGGTGPFTVLPLITSISPAASNTLIGSTGDDTLQAGDSGDLLIGNGGADFLEGGEGNDTVFAGDSSGDPTATGASKGDATIFGGDGADSIIGGLGDDFIDGQGGDDTIHGGAGNDTVDGESGEDWLFGDAGNDSISGGDDADSIGGGTGNDTVDGGTGGDLISKFLVDPNTGALVVVATQSVQTAAPSVVFQPDDTTDPDGDPIPDPNTPGPDDQTDPGPGDSVDGGTGDDTIIGGPQDDSLNGGDGNDSINGGDGNDIINGQDGDNIMNGGAGDDILSGGIGNNQFFGDDGNDVILNANGLADSVDGGAGTNIAQDDPSGADTIVNAQLQDPNPADDSLAGTAGVDQPLSSVFNDATVISNTAALPVIVQSNITPAVDVGIVAQMVGTTLKVDHSADTVNDKIVITQNSSGVHVQENGHPITTFPAAGITVINVLTGTGNDYISLSGVTLPSMVSANAGKDTVIGGNGNDTLLGGDGDDSLQGMSGDDSLEGDGGNDSLYGGAGTDYLNGGFTGFFNAGSDGTDLMDGGAGNDYVDYRWRVDGLTIRLDGTSRSGAPGEADKILNTVENALGGSGADLIIGNAQANYLSGGAGADTIFGNGGTDAMVGGTDIDNVYGGAVYSYFYLSGDGIGDGFSLGNANTGFVEKDTSPPDIGIPKQNPPA